MQSVTRHLTLASVRWKIELAARAFINIPLSDLLFSLRRDDYMQIRVAWYF